MKARVRYVIHKHSNGRARSLEFRGKSLAINFARANGGCVHRVTYRAGGMIVAMRKIACYGGALGGMRRRRRKRR